MDEGERSKGSWWQTVPGLLTATAGVITAAAGLLVTLHQIGLLGNKEKPAVQSPSSHSDITRRPEATAPAAAPAKEAESSKAGQPAEATKASVGERAKPYSITFPSGAEVTLRSGRSDATYKILSAQVDRRTTGKLALKIAVRLTNMGRVELGFGNDSFRLAIDGVPRAPINFLNTSVEARSAKEGDVVFEVPDTAESLVLSVRSDGDDTAEIPILLKKSR